ncbi:hypothetical protein T484DRAFT_1645464, partial [Baffinella frigidus]
IRNPEPKPQTPNPKLQTPNPEPQTPNPNAATFVLRELCKRAATFSQRYTTVGSGLGFHSEHYEEPCLS